MQVFVRDHCSMIAAPVQRDVDEIPKRSHFARVPPMGWTSKVAVGQTQTVEFIAEEDEPTNESSKDE
jgi:hypothetical protein